MCTLEFNKEDYESVDCIDCGSPTGFLKLSGKISAYPHKCPDCSKQKDVEEIKPMSENQ